jgi:hypothetical protein
MRPVQPTPIDAIRARSIDVDRTLSNKSGEGVCGSATTE